MRRMRTLLVCALSMLFTAAPAIAAPAIGQAAVTAAPPPGTDFQQIRLAAGPDQMGEPMSLAVLPDGSVLHDSRDGAIYYTTVDGLTTTAAKLDAYTHDEDGLQGIALDPNFQRNHWVYLFYAPKLNTPTTDAPLWGTEADFAPYNGYNQLSRFIFSNGKLDLASEQKIMQVGPTNRGICCHVGGYIQFDGRGNLLLSTGDDTNPFASDNYSPLDERPNRNPAFDAQRSAGNTNDLRGKLLRIHVEKDGSYSIPEGNLFEPDKPKTRPEIYAMGFRNPFRFVVDREADVIYLADYGPDAQKPNPLRGPENTVEFNRVDRPGNYGWPYCIGDNTPYVQYDFATGKSGQPFDCAHPKNTSRNNTGLVDLPPAIPAWIWNHYAGNPLFPELGGEGAPMAGPVYHYDQDLNSQVKFPAAYDGQFFAYEFSKHWIKPIQMNEEGVLQKINTFTTGRDWAHLVEPIDMQFGPDGSMYVLDYGSAWFGGSLDAALYKIEYSPGAKAPTANITATPTSGKAPLTVQFNGSGSTDPQNSALTYAWDFTNKGIVDSTAPNPTFTYTANGQYYARLVVKNASGRTSSAAVLITVGNTAPIVQFTTPPNGLTFSDGDVLNWQANATDPNGTPVDCSRMQVNYLLGHDMHAHGVSQATGCSGTFKLTTAGHRPTSNFYGILTASYTNRSPTPGVPDLTTKTQIVLQPKVKRAEFFNSSFNVQVTPASGAAGKVVSSVRNGSWIEFDPYHLQGIKKIDFRVASATSGSSIEVRADSPTGPLLGTAPVPNTGGTTTYGTATAPVTDPGGTHRLYFVFTGGSGDLFTVDYFTMS